MQAVKRRIFDILEHADPNERVGRWFGTGLMTLIVLNVLATILETVNALEVRFQDFFYWFEAFSVVIFTLEYVLRIWSCTVDERFRHPLWGRLRTAVKPMTMIDLLSILPFYLPLLFPDMRFLRVLRLFRLFRLLKLARYSDSISSLGNVLWERKEDLSITFSAIMLLLVFASSFMYFIEHGTQPEKFSSIPAAMWWGVATLTTVGYGDVFPMTPLGRFLGSIIAVLGIGMFALPAGILASGFGEEIRKRQLRKRKLRAEMEAEAKKDAVDRLLEELAEQAHPSVAKAARAAHEASSAGWSFCPHCGERLPAEGASHEEPF